MSFLIILGLIILGLIILVLGIIGLFWLVMYAVASGIAYKDETGKSAWDYWETMKSKPWADISEEEKEKLIIANLVIADDVGAVVTKEQLIKMLEEQLPIIGPNVGLSYHIGYE